MTSPHEIVTPSGLIEPVGFSHVVVPAAGRTVHLGGQTAHDAAGMVIGATIVEQFDKAAGNVITALAFVGAEAEHLVSMQIYVTDMPAYRASLRELAAAYKKHFGRHYPAIALLGVAELFDPAALVELVCTAVIPEA